MSVLQKSGKTYYVFPDAANNQAYVGGPKQYQAYRQLRLEKKLADEKVEAAEMNLEASEMNWAGGVAGEGGVRPGIKRPQDLRLIQATVWAHLRRPRDTG